MSYTDKMQDAAQNFAKSVNPDFVRALGDGGSGILFATVDMSTMALDKTWQELVNADVAYILLVNGTSEGHMHLPIIHMEAVQNDAYYVVALGVAKVTGEDVDVSFEPMLFVFKATSADGYPQIQMQS